MMTYPKPETRDFVPMKGVQVYDKDGILMVIPVRRSMSEAVEYVEERGYTVVHLGDHNFAMVVTR